jgi:hypothetical protein
MNEYEIIEATYAIRQAGATDVSSFFTVLSAYLVVAYLVGDKLSKFQLWSITGLYTLYLYFPIAATHIAVADLAQLDAVPPGAEYLRFVLVLMWLVSIVFMIQKRRESRLIMA